MRSCLSLTLALVIEAIKVKADSGAFLFCKMPTTTVLIEVIVDFLYRLKDRHPSNNFDIWKNMDVFYTIMEFLIPNGYLPSVVLHEEYSKSKITKKLNTLPSLEYLNSKFDKNSKMSEIVYERLRKRFESRPPFVFYFNPNIQLLENVDDEYIIGFLEVYDVSANKWNRI